MKIKIAIMISAMVSAASADVFRYGRSVGYDPMTEVKVNHSNKTADLYNYNTNTFHQVNVTPNGRGGYTGFGIDHQTGKMFDVNVNSSGNVDIWEY